MLLEAVTRAGYSPAIMCVAFDVASTELYENGKYVFHKSGGLHKAPRILSRCTAGGRNSILSSLLRMASPKMTGRGGNY